MGSLKLNLIRYSCTQRYYFRNSEIAWDGINSITLVFRGVLLTLKSKISANLEMEWNGTFLYYIRKAAQTILFKYCLKLTYTVHLEPVFAMVLWYPIISPNPHHIYRVIILHIQFPVDLIHLRMAIKIAQLTITLI